VDALDLFGLGPGCLAALQRGKGLGLEDGEDGAQPVGALGVKGAGVVPDTVVVGE
jgi:hypothetical protein